MNWAIFVSFDDGLDWVFRSPRSGSTFVSEESAQKMLLSEVATLKFLREQTSVPIPEVYSFRFVAKSFRVKSTQFLTLLSGSCDNPVGVPYILMSRANGRPLSDFDWTEISRQTPEYPQFRPLLPLPDGMREKVMRQLGAIMKQLSMIHLDMIGSLFQDCKGNYVVGECLSPALLWQQRDKLDGIERGPFLLESQYFESLISAFTSHASELPLQTHAFFAPIPEISEYLSWSSYKAAVNRWNDYVAIGSKIESSKNRLYYCLVGQVLRQMITHLSTPSEYFTLSHPDLHLGNIFIDEDFNITSLIDWASASAGPITELLATPGLGGSTFALQEPLTRAFRSGFGARPPFARWDRADMMWHFSRLVRLLSTQDYALFQALYKLCYRIEDEELDIPGILNDLAEEENNRHLLATLREDDYTTLELKKEEVAAFGISEADKSDRRAIARKLTVMAELNGSFLASSKLWRWIEGALRPGNDS